MIPCRAYYYRSLYAGGSFVWSLQPPRDHDAGISFVEYVLYDDGRLERRKR